jgi:uncharacterized protein involved in type VI secretion and phage assembly
MMKHFAELDSPLGIDLRFSHLSARERPQAALPPPPEGDEQRNQVTFAHERPQAALPPPPEGDEQSNQVTFAHESIGQPSELIITATSHRSDLDFKRLPGQHVTVRMGVSPLLQDKPRYFDGIVEQVSHVGRSAGQYQYQLVARAWFWFLSQTQDCRIFQDKTVLQIVEEVLADHPIAAVEVRTTGTYAPWVYCVQYRESDFQFLSRLMEQEGIYYFFAHESGKHVMVLADSISASPPCVGCRPLSVRHSDVGSSAAGSAVWNVTPRHRLQSGKVVLQDYDFTRPQLDLRQSSSQPGQHAIGDMEVFDYPGLYDKSADGEQFAQWTMESTAVQIGQEVIFDFLEGDPDQPIITGRAFNAQNMPPWELPANATQSGVLTRSSKGGNCGNANAIRFEDKQGAEQLWIHAEKNQDNEVENDDAPDPGGCRPPPDRRWAPVGGIAPAQFA